MSDIFLSYSRDDRDAVEPLAEALAREGYSVWWDRNLTGGQRRPRQRPIGADHPGWCDATAGLSPVPGTRLFALAGRGLARL